MSGFLGGLFESKSASSGPAISRAISQSPSRYGYWSSAGNWDTDKAVNDGYEKIMLVWRCIDAIATNQSQIPLLHRRGDARNGTILQSPKLMQLLNVRPNIYETANQFRYRLTSQALVSRKGAFIEIVGDPTDPESLHLLPPQSVEPIPDAKKFVAGYKVRGVDMQETILKPEQVIWVKLKPHPIDPYVQMTPLVTLGITLETDWLARMFNRNFLMSDGRPGLLISVRGDMDPEDAAEIKRRFSGGPAAAGQTTVIEGDGMDVVDLGSTPRDSQWVELLDRSSKDIMKAFGVPESVLGDASGRTFDNADAEYEMFWTHTMKPHCEAIAGALDRLTGDMTDTTSIAYDYDTVDVLQRQERRRQDSIIDRWSRGVITWNEMRESLGLSVWKDALAARIIVLPSGFAMAELGDDQAKIMQLPNTMAPQQQDALSEIARQGAKIGAREGARSMNNVLAARALQLAGKAAVQVEQVQPEAVDAVPLAVKHDDIVDAVVLHPFLEERKSLEATLDGLLIGMSSRQETVVCDRLGHAKVRKGTRHWDGEEKAQTPFPYRQLDALYAVEVDRWVRETRDDFERVLGPILKREQRRVLRDITQNMGGMDADRATELREAALQEVLSYVESSVRKQSQRVAKVIQDRDAEGASLDDIKRDVQKMIGTRSTWRKGLSSYTAYASAEAVRHALYEAVGGIKKTWNTQDDERVRTSHDVLDGKTIAASGMFSVGESLMRFPLDPQGAIEEVAGCRCWITYSA